MRLKSFLVTIVALFVLANVIVAAMQRCGIVPAPEGALEGGQQAEVTTPPSVAGVGGDGVAAALAATTLPTVARPPAGIEGLQLQLSRPLMFDIGALGGLAAEGAYLYVAAWDASAEAPMLYQVEGDSQSIAQVRALSEEGVTAVGGIDAGGGRVWAPLVRGAGDSRLILGVDAATLEVRELFEAPLGVVALAVGAGDRIYGVSADGATWLEWLPDGTPVREVAAVGGVRYSDLAYAGGSLLAAGSDGHQGVVDVIDPLGFSLLVRHACDGGAWVTGGGLEVTEEVVLLLPEGGSRPSVLTYVPEGSLAEFAPSVVEAGW